MSAYRSDRDAGAIAPRSVGSAPPPRRRHTRLARLVGALALVTLTATLYWLLTDDAFRVDQESVSFRGLAHADEAQVRELLTELDRAPNVFRVRAGDIVNDLSILTEVDAASATVTLPAGVSVRLDERDPVFVWSDGEASWLVDEQGMLFDRGAPVAATDTREATDEAPAGTETESEAGSADPATDPRAALPVVEDARLTDPAPTVGSYLSTADQEIMRTLLAVTPELLDSRSESLHLRVDERDGYVLESRDEGWRAVFGHYTPSVQPPSVIPRQVQCLRWLLAAEERRLSHARLVPSVDTCGTFTTTKEKRTTKD